MHTTRYMYHKLIHIPAHFSHIHAPHLNLSIPAYWALPKINPYHANSFTKILQHTWTTSTLPNYIVGFQMSQFFTQYDQGFYPSAQLPDKETRERLSGNHLVPRHRNLPP